MGCDHSYTDLPVFTTALGDYYKKTCDRCGHAILELVRHSPGKKRKKKQKLPTNKRNRTKKILVFAKEFSKLRFDKFTSVRAGKFRLGELLDVNVKGTYLGRVRVIKIVNAAFNQLSTKFICEDMDVKDRRSGWKRLKQFYPHLKKDRKLTILAMEWMEKYTDKRRVKTNELYENQNL